MLNQFAKINPIVTNDGYLLEQDTNGDYTIKSIVRLKENEIGICIDDKSFIMLFKGAALKITGGLFDTLEEAIVYAELNTNNSHTGEIIHIKNTPTKLYTLIGTKLYNLTENNKKSITVTLIGNDPSSILNNSTMQDPVTYINGRYIINNINIKLGENYSFKVVSLSGEGVTITDEYPYVALQLNGSISGTENIFISDGFKNNITTSVLDKEFVGLLSLKLYAWVNSSSGGYTLGNQITEYEGNSIQVTIDYTPIS